MNTPADPGGAADLVLQHRVEQLLYLEGRLIDERRFDEWTALWTEDGIYWVPANHEDADPRTKVSLIYDNRSRMANRIERFTGGKAISQQPPPRTVHLVGNVSVEQPHRQNADRPDADASEAGGVDLVVHSTLQVAESRPGIRVDWVGRVTHHLVERDDGFKIAFKKVVLVDLDQELTTIDFLL